jgi:hypothetical protein
MLAVVVAVVVDEDLLLPQAATPTLSATSANATAIPDLNLSQPFRRLRLIRVLPPCLLCRSE